MTPYSLRYILYVAAVIVTLCEITHQNLHEQQGPNFQPAFLVEQLNEKSMDFPSFKKIHHEDQAEKKQIDLLLLFKRNAETVRKNNIDRIRRVRQATYPRQSAYIQHRTNNTKTGVQNVLYSNYSTNNQPTYLQINQSTRVYPNIQNFNNTQSGQWSQYPNYYPKPNNTHLNGYPGNHYPGNYQPYSPYPASHNYLSSWSRHNPGTSLNSSNNLHTNHTNNYPGNSPPNDYQTNLNYPSVPNYLSSWNHHYTGQSLNSTNRFLTNYSNNYPGNSRTNNYQPNTTYPSAHNYPSPWNNHYPGQSLNSTNSFETNITKNYPRNSRPNNYHPNPSYISTHNYSSPWNHPPGHLNYSNNFLPNNPHYHPINSQPGNYQPYPNYPSGHNYPSSWNHHTGQSSNASNGFPPNSPQTPGQGNLHHYPGGHNYPSYPFHHGQVKNTSSLGSNYSYTQQGHYNQYHPYPVQEGNLSHNSSYGYNYPQNPDNINQGHGPIPSYRSNVQSSGPHYLSNAQGDVHYSTYPQYPSSNPGHSPQFPVGNSQWNTVIHSNLSYADANEYFNKYPSSNLSDQNDGHLYYSAQKPGPNIDPLKVNPRDFA